jgi:hypothetical protein
MAHGGAGYSQLTSRQAKTAKPRRGFKSGQSA